MAFECETKILEVNPNNIRKLLKKLGAKKVLQTRLYVDWFEEKAMTFKKAKWFLRIRTDTSGNAEITWKAKSKITGKTRRHREINIKITEPKIMELLFQSIGLKKYAHQEKDRISWNYKNWHFDLDTYPNMSPYLEIEGKSDKHIQQAIKLLKLASYEQSAEGERVLIERKYKINWFDMRF